MQDPKVTSAVARLQELKSTAASVQALMLAHMPVGFEETNDSSTTVSSPYIILQGLSLGCR